MIVGCYDMHLYCRHTLPLYYGSGEVPEGHHDSGEFPHQFTGRNERECLATARKRGWKFSDGDATCPRCVQNSKVNK